jgi:hypothetical protein
MASIVKWLMGDLLAERRRQASARLVAFVDIGKWKAACPSQVADYYHWHSCRGQQQQIDWFEDPSMDRSLKNIREIEQFDRNFQLVRTSITNPPPNCPPCTIIQTLLTTDQQSIPK